MNNIEVLESFLKLDPADSFTRFALATEYRKAGRAEVAEKHFRQLLEDDPDYIGTYYHLGKLLESMGSVEEAVRIYDLGIQKADTLRDTHAASELRQARMEID